MATGSEINPYLLVFHGSSDPRYQAAVAELMFGVAARLNAPLVKAAFLEAYPMNPGNGMETQITEFAAVAAQKGYTRINILPVFLHPGVHVMEDIPKQVAQAEAEILLQAKAKGELPVKIHLEPYIGQHTGAIAPLLAQQIMAEPPATAWILLAHGSRREGGNQSVEDVAQKLTQLINPGNGMKMTPIEICTAYWSVAPSLEERLAKLVAAGHRQVGILPYFLFPGGITEAIARHAEELSHTHGVSIITVNPPRLGMVIGHLVTCHLSLVTKGQMTNDKGQRTND